MTSDSNEYYKSLQLSEDEKSTGGFREHLGGGPEHWDQRGRFQIAFLTRMGLLPHHRFLDIGCGPIRAGVHFIEYLDADNYCGMDYTPDFIEIARRIVAEHPELNEKRPKLMEVADFQLDQINATFDFALAFSVLNHSTEQLRSVFFDRLPLVLAPGGRAYISHANWFTGQLPSKRLVLKRTVRSAAEIDPDLDMKAWGWTDCVRIFPILEIEHLP